MATDAERAVIQRQGLLELFDKLFHRGRLAQRNAQFTLTGPDQRELPAPVEAVREAAAGALRG